MVILLMSFLLHIKNIINSFLGIQQEDMGIDTPENNHIEPVLMGNNSNAENISTGSTCTINEKTSMKPTERTYSESKKHHNREYIKRKTKHRKITKINYFTWRCDACIKLITNKDTYMYKDHKFCSFKCRDSFDHSGFNPY